MPTRLIRFLVPFLALLLGSCGGGGGGGSPGTAPATAAKWTYMVYIAADNNLSDAALGDLQEMASVGSNASVNIVVQVEGRPSDTPGTYRGRMLKDQPIDSLALIPGAETGGGIDMGNPQTLTNFIQWAKANHPADNYALVLWSHGAGWKTQSLNRAITRGALQDETSGTFMSLDGIAKGIRDSGVHFGLINFDACLMAMYEVAYSLRGTADYLVASEEVSPSSGDNYAAIAGALVATPSMNARTLASSIVDSYHAFYVTEGRSAVTKSVIDLNKIAAVKTSLDALAANMSTNIGTLRTAIQTAQSQTTNYEYRFNRDIGDFVSSLKEQTTDATLLAAATAVETALGDAVVSNQVFAPAGGNPITRSKGLSIYLPQKGEIGEGDLDLYLALDVSGSGGSPSAWVDFLSVLLTGDTGTPYQQRAVGNFAFFITWDNPNVDLDLFVYEPLNLVAPFMGTTSANGFLSGDSSETGEQVEYYAAASTVEAGDYDVFINYFGGVGSTTVTVWYDNGTGPAVFATAVLKDPSKADAPAGTYPDNSVEAYAAMLSNTYGDWNYPITHRATYDSSVRAYSAPKTPKALAGKALAQRVHYRLKQKSTVSGQPAKRPPQ